MQKTVHGLESRISDDASGWTIGHFIPFSTVQHSIKIGGLGATLFPYYYYFLLFLEHIWKALSDSLELIAARFVLLYRFLVYCCYLLSN